MGILVGQKLGHQLGMNVDGFIVGFWVGEKLGAKVGITVGNFVGVGIGGSEMNFCVNVQLVFGNKHNPDKHTVPGAQQGKLSPPICPHPQLL